MAMLPDFGKGVTAWLYVGARESDPVHVFLYPRFMCIFFLIFLFALSVSSIGM